MYFLAAKLDLYDQEMSALMLHSRCGEGGGLGGGRRQARDRVCDLTVREAKAEWASTAGKGADCQWKVVFLVARHVTRRVEL